MGLAIVAALALAPLGLSYPVHALLYPWALSFTGSPTLPGYWYGQASFPTEGRRRVVMHLVSEPKIKRCGKSCPKVEGAIKVCDPGRPSTYEVWGDVADRSASRMASVPSIEVPSGVFTVIANSSWSSRGKYSLPIIL